MARSHTQRVWGNGLLEGAGCEGARGAALTALLHRRPARAVASPFH